jgi:hypothetical protein
MTRLLTISWLACLAIALWIAALTPQASGYELSLMDAYPPLFWALTIGASACSAGILLILATRQQQSRWWASGVLGIIATNMAVLSLPLFRGYVVSDRADALNHIGYARDIMDSGRISQLDFYPGMHLIQVAIETIGGITAGQAFVVVNLLFAIVWTIGLVVLVQRLAGDVRAAYLAAAFSAPFVLLTYHSLVLPSTLSAMLLPILIALHLRRASARGWDRVATGIAEIVLAFLLVYFHPVTTIYSMALMLAFEVALRARRFAQRHSSGTRSDDDKFYQTIGMVTLLGVTFFTWTFSFTVITKNMRTVLLWLMGENERSSAASEALGLLQIARLPIADLAGILANAFGVTTLVIGLAYVFVAVLLWNSLRQRRMPGHAHFMFVGAFLTTTAITVALFLISSSERHPIRLVRILVILGLCGMAWWCWEAIFHRTGSAHWPKLGIAQRRLAIGAVSSLLLVTITMGQLNVYPHPRNGQPNAQVTRTEVAGMSWLVQNRTGNFKQASILPKYVPRYEAFLLGYAGLRTARPNWWDAEIWLPSHFYAQDWRCMADIAPGQTTYLALSDAGRISPLRFPEAVRDLAHQYTAQDWQALASDHSVSKLYDNGGFEVWMTNKEAAACR